MYSIILHGTLLRDMGRQLLVVILSPPLWTGVTYASFHCVGSIPESIEAWNMCFKRTSTSKTGLRILSGPGHFSFGKLFISLIRPSVVTFIGSASFVSSLTVYEIWWPSQNWSLKYLFSISAHCDASTIVLPCGLTSFIGESLHCFVCFRCL